jgi:hypothetical protein
MIIVSAVVFALILGVFLFAVMPRCSGWRRAVSATMFIVLLAIVYAGSIEMLSRPKPLRLEWRDPAKAKVLGVSMREGKAIYLWLQVGDSGEPRAYALPWNMRMAEQLQNAMRQASAEGRPLEARHPLAASASAAGDPGKPRFYPRPQPPSPPKNYAQDSAAMMQASPSGGASLP